MAETPFFLALLLYFLKTKADSLFFLSSLGFYEKKKLIDEFLLVKDLEKSGGQCYSMNKEVSD